MAIRTAPDWMLWVAGSVAAITTLGAVCAVMYALQMSDFIERYFGFSPDDGNGSIEALLIVVLFTLIAAVAVRMGARRHA